MKHQKNRKNRKPRKHNPTGSRSKDTSNRVARAISQMRTAGASLRKASRDFGLDPRTVVRRGRSALRKLPNGRYATKADDRIVRVLVLPTPTGLIEVAVRDSRDASQVGQYWDSVDKYLQTGDASGLQKFEGKIIIDSDGQRVPLLTDTEELDRLGSAGVLSFESVYAGVA
jgi:hypothetical protein